MISLPFCVCASSIQHEELYATRLRQAARVEAVETGRDADTSAGFLLGEGGDHQAAIQPNTLREDSLHIRAQAYPEKYSRGFRILLIPAHHTGESSETSHNQPC